jgi:hypothetical protein
MPESGGPTTESGIIYQNSIAALFMGRMCDVARRPDRERVLSVRVEAPLDVDDTVVTFADDHREYIQAKESIRVGQEPWAKLWRDFDQQFRRPEFQRGQDRLLLHSGEAREEIRDLKEACLRASGSSSFEEWQDGLNQRQKELVEKIKPCLSPESLDNSTLLSIFGHIDVEIWSLVEMERDKVRYWMPPIEGGRLAIELFRLVRDRVGGEARRRGTFTAEGLRKSLKNEDYCLAIPPDIDSLREAVGRCGASLLQHKHTIANTGRHIRRGEVDSILAWARGELGVEPIAMLLDRAGMGKSVVIRDLLIGLEEAGIVTLAIKADRQLTGVDSHNSLQVALGLPEPVERVIGRLAALGPVVVLVDQIDALSLSLARDQKALDIVLELVARLRLIPGVRILISCRAFDRNGDPRLRSIEIKSEFYLAELLEAEVESVLRSVGVEYDGLSPTTRKLLRVPLHLDLLARAVESQVTWPRDPEVYRGIGNLQSLYALVWKYVVLKPDPNAPPNHERLEVLGLMTEAMFNEQRTAVSMSLFNTADTARLERSLTWLASQGIIVDDSNEWSFLHQTFYDYSYARRFVEQGRKLAPAILESDQGLRFRPLLVQVLSYLRDGNERKYLGELNSLFAAEGMRHHLRDLLVRWFGALPEPSDGEWNLAFRGLLEPSTRTELLAAMVGNRGWFERINGEPLETLLALDDTSVDTQVIPYLTSMLGESQFEVVSIGRKILDRGGAWTIRAARIVSSIRNWDLPEAAELFERLATELDEFLPGQSYLLDNIAKIHPRVGCRLVRRLLDRVLEDFVAKRQQVPAVYYSSLNHELDQLNSGMVFEAMTVVSEAEPGYFCEILIPWLEKAINLSAWPGGREDFFGHDDLCHGWHDGVYVIRFTLIRAFVSALVSSASLDIEGFRRLTTRLAAIPYLTPQMLLAQVYQSEPGLLASDALEFLLADRRRLDLGERDQYESRKVIAAIYPFLSTSNRARLEAFILDNPRPWKHLGLHGLRWRGQDQLYLLQAIPVDDLTERGWSYLHELERKFPGIKASEDPRMMIGGWVGSPIAERAIRKMTDRHWLSAMKSYRPGVARRELLRGGHRELGGALLTAVKDDPERFYSLVAAMSDEDIGPYAWAFVNGITESSAPDEWLFDLVRRFARITDSEGRRAISWALRRRVETRLPDDLMDLLESWVRDVTLDREGEFAGDPDSGYLNSDRGAALGTLMGALDQRGSVETRAWKWRLIELVATDPSTTLRAGAVEGLLHLLREDRERAVSLFEKLMTGHPTLLRSQRTQEFLYHGFYKNFGRLAPFIRALMDEPAKEHAQRGAELACIAAISPLAIESLGAHALALGMAEEAINGPTAWRRGAARVYTTNLHNGSPNECLRGLSRLLDDEDDSVRYQVGGLFASLPGSYLRDQREFLARFASSRCLVEGMRHLAKYLWGHWQVEPETTLALICTALDSEYEPAKTNRHFDAEELIRVVLRVYADPGSSEAVCRTAMDVFDKLMSRYSVWAQKILEEWDRV